jgi:hypothetical protein
VPPLGGLLIADLRFAYLGGTLLALILLLGLGGIARAWRGDRRALAGRGGPGLLPWLASITLLLAPVLTADYSERYVLIAAPAACLAAGLAFARTSPEEHPVSPAASALSGHSRPTQPTPAPTSPAPGRP